MTNCLIPPVLERQIDDPAAADTTAMFSIQGTYILRLTAFDGELSASDDVMVSVLPEHGQEVTVQVRVSASSDDAEEKSSGKLTLSSSDLELIPESSDQQGGMGFTGVDVPSCASIVSAYIQFQVDEKTSEATSLIIQAEATDNAATFSSTSFDISSRNQTVSAVSWDPPPWISVAETGPDQRTADLAPVIQEIVTEPGWSNGNSLVVIITGTGKRVAESYNGHRDGAPLLIVTYVSGQ